MPLDLNRVAKPVNTQTKKQQVLAQQVNNKQSSYQKNATTVRAPELSSSRDVLGRIYEIGQSDPGKAKKLYSDFQYYRTDPSSPVYNAYAQPTSVASSKLKELGIDTSKLTSDWFATEGDAFINQNLVRTSTSNNGKSPTKKFTYDQNVAYWLQQYKENEGTTSKAEKEYEDAVAEAKFWAGFTDRNYSDEEIIGKVNENFDKKYPTLAKMRNNTTEPIQLNRGVDFSDDVLYGAIWEGRNPDFTGNMEQAIAYSALGRGNQYQYNEEIANKLNPNSPDFQPYSIGATNLDDAARHFGVDIFTDEWILEHNGLQYQDNEDGKYFRDVLEAHDIQQKVDTATGALDAWMQKNAKGMTPEEAQKKLDKVLDRGYVTIDRQKVDLSILNKMDKTMGKGNELGTGNLIPMTKGSDYKYSSAVSKFQQMCLDKSNAGGGIQYVDDAASAAGDPSFDQMTDTEKDIVAAEDKTISEAVDALYDDASPAEQTVWSKMASRSYDYVKNAVGQFKSNIDSMRGIAESTKQTAMNDHASAVLGNFQEIYNYDMNVANITAWELERDSLIKQSGINRYAGMEVEPEKQKTITVNGRRFNVIYSLNDLYLDDNGNPTYEIAQVNELNNGDVFNVDDETMQMIINSDEGKKLINDANQERANITEAKANGVELSEEDQQVANRIRELDLLIEDATAANANNEEAYLAAGKAFDEAQLKYDQEIYVLKALGVDTTDLEQESYVVGKLAELGSYEATVWNAYDSCEAYRIALQEGASTEEVMAAAKEGQKEIEAELKEAQEIREYIDRTGLNIPSSYSDNLNRKIAKLERMSADYENFALTGNDDFEEMAHKGRQMEYDSLKDAFNNLGMAISMDEYFRIQDEEQFLNLAGGNEGFSGVGLKSLAGDLYSQMTDEEKDIYYYLKGTGQDDRANEYLNSLTDASYGVLHTRFTEELEAATREFVGDGAGGFIGSNILAILASPFAAMTSLGYMGYSLVTGKELNPDNAGLFLNNFRSTTREQSAQEISDYFGAGTIGNTLVQGFYEILTNRLDSLANGFAFGGFTGGIGNKMLNELISASPMGVSAAMDAMMDAKRKGASDAQAWGIGLVTFIAETGTEAVSLDNIREAFKAGEEVTTKGMKDFLVNWLTKAGVSEMTGESVNEIVEKLADEKILGVLSDHNELVWSYRMKGYDKDTAEAMARADEAKQLAHTALISYLSPGLDVLGYAKNRTDYYRQRTRELQKNGLNVNLLDVYREGAANIKEAREAENAPARESGAFNLNEEQSAEQNTIAPDEGQRETEEVAPEQGRIEVENAPEQGAGIAMPEETAEITNVDIEKDYSILTKSANADESTKTATMASVLDLLGTEESGDLANAAAANMDRIAEGYSSPDQALADMLLWAMDCDEETVGRYKQAIQNAILSGNSEAFRVMQTSEYIHADLEQRPLMLAATVESDAANETVQNDIAKEIHENRVAREELNILLNGGTEKTQAANEKADNAAIETNKAREALEERQDAEAAAGERTQAAMEAVLENPSDHTLVDEHHSAVAEQGKRAAETKEYEQSAANAEERQKQAETEAKRVKEQEQLQIRQQAEAAVAEKDRQREERKAQEAEQQRIADEEAARMQAEEDERTGKAQEDRENAAIDQAVEAENLDETDKQNRKDELKEQKEKVKAKLKLRDLKKPVTSSEGMLALYAFQRKLGIQIDLEDLGPITDKGWTRGKYTKEGKIVLNKNMTLGQALVEAALHEITHSMKNTDSYKTFRDVALRSVFKNITDTSDVRAMYDNDEQFMAMVDDTIKQRIAAKDPNFVGKTLDEKIAAAEEEIIADFARFNLAEKDVIERFMDAGMGGRMRNTLHNINQALKNFLTGMDPEERKTAEYLRRAERAFQKAMNEVAKTKIHPTSDQFSVQQIAQSTNVGMVYNDESLELYMPSPDGEIIGDGKNGLKEGERYTLMDGVTEGKKITPDMIVSTPVGMLIDMGLSDNVFTDKEGNEHTQKGDARQMFADLMNLCARYKDNNLIWEIAGSEFAENFSALKSNSDPQYKTTVDFGTICAKTQAIVDVISGTMLERVKATKEWNEAHPDDQKVFTGLTREDVMMVYDKTHNAELSVPCPVCYVFSRWMGVPSLLGQMNKFQHDFVETVKGEDGKTMYDENGDAVIDWDATEKKVNDYLLGDGEKQGILEKYGGKEAIADKKVSLNNKKKTRIESLPKLNQARMELEKQLNGPDPFAKEKEDIQEQLKNPDLKKGERSKLERKLASLDRKSAKRIDGLKAKIEKQDEKIKTNIRETDEIEADLKEIESFNWVTQALCRQHTEAKGKVVNDLYEDGRYMVDRENFRLTPEEILFDLNRTGEFAGYKKNWKYRTTRGAGMGKAIMPYSGASIGDIINGQATRWQQDQNPFYNMDLEEATKAFKNAQKRVKQQNLVGGQRFQSTSDFRPEWGLDYIMSFLEMQALGSKVQMYTKVAEAVDFLGSIGADGNLSIMPLGDGYHEATSAEIEQAKTDEELASRIGTITDENGVEHTYVMDFSDVTGMEYNTAKGKTKKFNNIQMILVGINDIHIKLAMGNKDIDFIIPWHSSGNSKDILQSLVASVGETLNESSDYTDYQTDQQKSHKEKIDGKEKTIDDRTEDEIKLWDARVKLLSEGGEALTKEERDTLLSNPFTKELYKRFTQEGYDPDCYNITLPQAQAEQIFPYEYWDKTSTRENADVNGQRFVKYCDAMGLVPRFSQFKNEPGYWKLLIDRKMYENNVMNEDGTVKEYGKYREQNVVDVTKARMDTDASQELDEQQKRKAEVYQLPESTTAKYGKNYSKQTQDAIYNANASLEEKYGTFGRYDAYAGNGEQLSYGGEMTEADLAMMNDAAEDYENAIRNGDKKAARSDIDYYAEKKGYTDRAFHGTDDFGFTEFDNSEEKSQGEIFVSYDRRLAGTYTESDELKNISDMDFRHLSDEKLAETVKKADKASGGNISDITFNPETETFEVTFEDETEEATRDELVDMLEGFLGDVRSRASKNRTSEESKFSGGIYRLYTRPGKQLVVDAEGSKWNKIQFNGQETTTREIGKWAKANGYDSVRINNVIDNGKNRKWGYTEAIGDIGIFFDQNDVKSGDLITRDNDGNMIPLNERFTDKTDIRYSTGGEMTEADQAMLREAEMNKALVDAGALTQEEADAYEQYSNTGALTDADVSELINQNGKEGTYNGNASGMLNSSVGYDAKDGQVQFDNAPSDQVRKNLERIGMIYDPVSQTWNDSNNRGITLHTIVKAVENGSRGISVASPSRQRQTKQPAIDKNMPTPAETMQAEVEAGAAAPLEGQNPDMTTGQGPKIRAFAADNGMLSNSDELDRFAKAVTIAQRTYFPDTNDEQINRAIKWIRSLKQTPNSDGYAEALQKVTGNDFDYRSADGQARMVAVMGLANAKNDVMAQTALADSFMRQGTDLGRALQVRKLFKLMTPEGRIGTLQKMIQNAKDEIAQKNGTNVDLTFSEWIYRAAAAAESEADFRKVQAAAAVELAEQLPINWKDRLQSFRMLAMLGNPRTHIRNIIGNAMFIPAVGLKNKLGALAELGMKQGNRTKTLAPILNSDVRQFARQDAETMKNELTGEAKYNENSEVKKAQKPLGKVGGWLSDLNSNALEKEDWIFLKGHYRRALGGWMQANGYTAEQLQNNPKLLEKGREYAIQEAKKATYRDFSATAQKLNQVSRNGGPLGFIVEAALPFRKTPINILKRGVEYSPAGIAKGLWNLSTHMKQYLDYQNGKLDTLPAKAVSPNQVIDQICSGLSGTAVMTLGYLLAGAGAVSCGLDDDEDKLEKLKGNQEYAINPGKALNKLFNAKLFGEDVTFTMDWAAPMSMPFFVGAAIREQQENAGDMDINKFLNAIGGIGEPVFNLSMLDGVNSLFKSSQYDDTNEITQILAKIGTNYVSSYIPSFVGATTRTFFDDSRRKSFVTKGQNTGLEGTVRYAWESAENKIPGASKTNIPYRDVWGNPETSGFVERFLENFILPGYVNEYKEDPIVNELGRLYQDHPTNSSTLIPKDADKSIEVKKGDVRNLGPEEWDKYQTVRGQTAYQTLTDLMNSAAYQNATDEAQIQMIGDAWKYATQVGKNAVFPEIEVEKKTIESIAEDGLVTSYKSRIIDDLESGNYEDYDSMVEALREAGVEDSTIKTKISGKYRDEYKEAYRKGNYERMSEIEEILDNTGYDFDIAAWEEQVDEKYGNQ